VPPYINPFPRYAYTTIPPSEVRCLALTIYYEGRGEPYAGRLAIAQVTVNRLKYDRFPNTICKIVYQPGQFDWTERRIKNPFDWYQALKLAKAFTAYNRLDNFADNTNGATSFHANSLHPDWSHLQQTVVIGHQTFFHIKEPVATNH